MPQGEKGANGISFLTALPVSLKLYEFSGFVIIVHAMLRRTMNDPRSPVSRPARKTALAMR
jgi:hypothetical protein